jgi:Phosphate transport (Pho88)
MVQFNKMMVMLPVMFAARKLNGEDPVVVYWLRIAYAVVQLLCVTIVLYTYWQARGVAVAAAARGDAVVYVPAVAAVRSSLSVLSLFLVSSQHKSLSVC